MRFRFSPDMSYAPLADADPWRPARLRSPVPSPGHALLRLRDDHVTRLRSRELARPSDRFRQVDLRRTQLTVHPQAVPTADGLNVTVSLVIPMRVVDPVAYVTESQRPDDAVYLSAQIALRELVASLTLDQIVAERLDLTTLTQRAAEAAAEVGLEVSTVLLKDLNLPPGFARAVEQRAVDKLTAETELERARTEVKTTRARLGTAKVMEQNPLLAKLRLIEALPPGTTLEIRAD